MASVSTEGGSSKIDTELNLVPFIDLLSTLVLFLLLTVVWVQIAAIPAGVDSKGKAATTSDEQTKLLVRVSRNGFALTWPQKLASDHLPQSVHSIGELSHIIQKHSHRLKQTPASVSGDDQVEYGQVIQALDALKSSGLAVVSLSTES